MAKLILFVCITLFAGALCQTVSQTCQQEFSQRRQCHETAVRACCNQANTATNTNGFNSNTNFNNGNGFNQQQQFRFPRQYYPSQQGQNNQFGQQQQSGFGQQQQGGFGGPPGGPGGFGGPPGGPGGRGPPRGPPPFASQCMQTNWDNIRQRMDQICGVSKPRNASEICGTNVDMRSIGQCVRQQLQNNANCQPPAPGSQSTCAQEKCQCMQANKQTVLQQFCPGETDQGPQHDCSQVGQRGPPPPQFGGNQGQNSQFPGGQGSFPTGNNNQNNMFPPIPGGQGSFPTNTQNNGFPGFQQG